MKKRFLGILLSFALMLTMMPALCLSQTAYAGDQKAYAAYDVTTEVNKTKSGDDLTALQVTFNDKQWYIIADNSTAVDAGTVTLLAADTSFGSSKFHDSSNAYSSSTVKGVLDALTAEGGAFASVKGAIADTNLSDVNVTGAKLYLLNTTEADSVPVNVLKFSTKWWLRSPGAGYGDGCAALVENSQGSVDDSGEPVTELFGVRPALQLDLSKVAFDTASKTFYIQSYPLWVGGTQVTSANKDDIPAATGGTRTGKASYDDTTHTLTLNNYSYTGPGYDGAAIESLENLTIESKGTNTVTQTGGAANNFGIYVGSGKSLTITGSGFLTSNAGATTGYTYSEGIFVGNQLIIEEDATVTATGGTCEAGGSNGVQVLAGLTVNGSLTASGRSDVSNSYGAFIQGKLNVGKTGTVNATGNYGVFSSDNMTISGSVTAVGTGKKGISSNRDVIINGGTVEATANGNNGIGIQTNFGAVVINGGTVEVSATGKNGLGIDAPIVEVNNATSFISIGDAIAIGKSDPESGGVKPGNVKNAIAGTGWENADGSGKKTDIAVNTSDEGQPLDFKKVQFPEKVDPKPEPPKPTPAPVVNNVPVVNTTAKSSTRSTTIKWTWNAVDGAQKYKVAYHKVGSKKWKVKTTKKTKYVLKGQKIKGLYEYKVAAVTASGDVWSDASCRYFKTVKAKAKFSKGALKVSWKKDKSASGYEIFIARNKKMDGAQVIQVAATDKSYSVTGLEKGRYYVKVRPMKNYNGVTYTGILCKAKKVRVK